ncbi:hybrid sensor histidine kinase/response regulator [Desulfatitalea alkaliphila]|uniref:histidine kinase n=1 Tax=Desulfatitalea alkaliphila TaxID=2929485 RepID=A0AA41QZ41_9BACT|nr:hybrid sensor histidine kinase/response regulator [Desulfatitalea alkaliphila]MCJ8498979.1 response regulator [Desulfatitalea alkaliphila]
MPTYVWGADPLTFWQERILFILCFITTAFGAIPLIPSVIMAYQEGLWSVILLDSVCYAIIVVLLVNRNWPLRLRGYIACLTFYGLGAGLLFILGPQGAGYIWLFGGSIMVISIVGLEGAFWMLLINTLTLLSASFYTHLFQPEWAPYLGQPLQKMLVLSINFLFFNTFATVTLGFMLNGLKTALEKERQVSAHLRVSEERYRIVADFNYDWEYWINARGRLEYVSPSCERITGYSPKAFMDDPGLLLAIVHETDREPVAQHLQTDGNPSKGVDNLDYRIVTREGQTRWISHSCQPVFDDEGRFLGRRAGNRDITDRKTIEDAIRLHHERFLTVLDSIDASIYVADVDSHEILFMNRHMIQRYDRDWTGHTCWQALRKGSGPCEVCRNRELAVQSNDGREVHSWQEQDPETRRWYVNYDRLIKWTDGRRAKIQIATDITEFKKMEVELRQSHKMEAIGTLAGGIAHDFNNLLYAIIGYAELCQDDAPEGSLLEANLVELLAAAKRASDLVRQILTFARQSDETVSPLSIAPVVKEALRLIRATLPSTIQIHSRINSQATVLANPTHLHQILMNLCTNAAHAMSPGGGTLTVSVEEASATEEDPTTTPDGQMVVLTVADTGTGIAPEHLTTIFEPYFTTKPPGEGTGMGLSVVHGIVEKCGAKLAVESRVGQGTTFAIRFPVTEEPAQAQSSAETAELPMGTEHVLVVDDEPAVLNAIGQTLQRLGYTVTRHTVPLAALDQFRARPEAFDLLITDMSMPQMNGHQLAREILRIRPDLPVILCTGYSNLITDETAFQTGIRAFATKPIAKKELAITVRDTLDGIWTK